MNEIVYRDYKSGDEEKIIKLFSETFSVDYSLKDWNWQYKHNPMGNCFICLAFVGERLAGSSAGVLFNYKVMNRNVRSIRIQHLMVHSDFRYQGISKQILINLADRSKSGNFDFIFTFPNNIRTSLRGFISLNYKFVDYLYIYTLPYAKIHFRTDIPYEFSLTEIPQFDQKDVDFINSNINQYSIYQCRTIEYLNWRYHQNSGHRYHVLRVFKDHVIIGLAIFKLYQKDNSIDLVELFLENFNAINLLMVLKIIQTKKTSWEIRGFNIWSSPQYFFMPVLKELGFEQSKLLTSIMIKNCSEINAVNNFSNYYFSFGDSDVY